MEEKIILVDSQPRFFAKFLSYVILVTGFMYVFSLGLMSEPDKLISGLLISGFFTGLFVLVLEQIWAGTPWGLEEYDLNGKQMQDETIWINNPPC
jgi:hypothetical protein